MSVFSLVAELIRLGAHIFTPRREDIVRWELEELRRIRRELEESEKERIQREVASIVKNADKIEDVDTAIQYLIASARNLACPVCRGLLLRVIEYLKRYDYIVSQMERGLSEEEASKKYEEERRKKDMEEIERLRKELLVDDISYRKATEKFVDILSEELGGVV